MCKDNTLGLVLLIVSSIRISWAFVINENPKAPFQPIELEILGLLPGNLCFTNLQMILMYSKVEKTLTALYHYD